MTVEREVINDVAEEIEVGVKEAPIQEFKKGVRPSNFQRDNKGREFPVMYNVEEKHVDFN